MQEDQNVHLSTLLERAGFEKTSRPGWVTWVFSGREIKQTEKSKKKSSQKKAFEQKNLWTVRHIEVTERKGVYQMSGLRLNLDYERFRENLVRAARKFFGARTTPTIVECGRGTFWVLLEFVKSGTKKKQIRQQAADYMPYGVAGFKLGIGTSGGNVEAYFSEFFGIGFVPQSFATAHMRILLEALDLRKLADQVPSLVEQRSLFETVISPKFSLMLAAGGQQIDPLLAQFVATKDRPLPFAANFTGDDLGFEMGENENTFDPRGTSPVPVVVLESRERVDGLLEIDALLADGKVSRACRLIADATRTSGPTTYLQQRLGLLSVCGQDIPADVSQAHENVEPVERKLSLSHKVRLAALNDRMDLVLAHLSELGRLLATDVPDIESVKSFDLVIPELLGDAWAPINPRKAEACYERILQRCGDLPRILRKIIALTAGEADEAREFRLLSRLVIVERRKNELAAIYFRMAQLARKNRSFHAEPVELTSKALQNDRNHYQSALLTAECLAEANKPNEAIALLDQMLADGSINIPQKSRAKIEFAIGHIWMTHLSRQDLAERRFERAVALDDGHIESLSSLERIYRDLGHHQKIGSLLEKQFDAYERSGDLENLKRVFEELVELFRGPMGQPKKAYELYQRMIALAVVEPEEIDRLMAWRDIEIDWVAIYQKLAENLANLPHGNLSARYHMRLAEICRDKTDNPDGALTHYLAALDHGGIDAAGFRYVVEILTAVHDFDRLSDAYEARLQQVNGDERTDLIGELLSSPGVLSDARRDQLAVEAYAADEGNASLLFQRLKFYQSMDDVEGIERLGHVIEEAVESAAKVSTWLRNLSETLLDCVDPAKYRAIDRLYRKMYDVDVEPVAILVEAIGIFKDTMDAGRSSYYVRELLKHDQLPDLSSKLVARYLVGFDADLAKFHYLKAAVAKSKEDICSDARVAFAIYKRLPGHHKMQEKALHLIGMHEELTDAELKDLQALAGVNDNWTEAAKVYQRQSDLSGTRERKGRLLTDQGRMLWKDARDHGRARLAYVMALNYVEKKAPLKMVLAQLAEESGQQEQELRALVDYVLDPDSLAEPSVYQRAVTRMLALGKEPYSVYKMIRSQLAEAASDDDNSIVLKVSETLISSGLMNQELFVLAFRASIVGRYFEEAVDYWWRGLRSIQNRSGIRAYIADTQAILKNADREDLLIKCYRSAIQNGVTAEVSEQVKQEVLVQYGLVLFDSDMRRAKALPIFKEAYKNDPSDSRTWLPVYFILEEQGDQYQQFLFLKEMIVRLREDTRPLRQYPITVESLEKQLRELAMQFNDQRSEQSFISESEDIAMSAEGTGLSVVVQMDRDLDIPQARVAGESLAFGSAPEKGNARLSLVMTPDEAAGPVVEEAPEEVEDSTQVFVTEEPASVDVSDVAPDVPDMGASPDASLTIDWNLPLAQVAEQGGEQHAPSLDGPAIDLSDVTITFGDGQPHPVEGTANPEVNVLDLGMDSMDLVPPPQEPEVPEVSSAEANLAFDPGALGIDLSDIAGVSAPLAGEPGQPVFSLDGADSVVAVIDGQDAGSVDAVEGSFDPTSALSMAPDLQVPPPPPTPGHFSVSDDDSGAMLLNSGVAVAPEGDVSSVELAAAFSSALPAAEASVVSAPDSNEELNREGSELSIPPPPAMDQSQGSIHLVNAGLDDGQAQGSDVGDWRALVLSGNVTEDLTERIMRKAFANEVEKHVAIQSIALIAGNCDLLESWHWRVWRSSKEYGYPLAGRDRYNAETTSPALQSPLHQLVLACNPLMAKVFRERFTLDYAAKALGTNIQTVEKSRKEVSWKQGVLHDAGFHLFQDRIAKRGYKAFSLSGLGSTVFFDGPNKSVYFDDTWFAKYPPSVLFNRISVLLWSIRLQYVIPLALDPKKQALPFFMEVFQKLDMQGISRFAEKLKGKSTLGKHLSTMDVRSLRALKQKCGNPTEAHMTALWFAMQEHVYKLLLSETLDIIGLLEAITKKDLTKPGALQLKDIYKKSPYAKSLLEFVTKLVL